MNPGDFKYIYSAKTYNVLHDFRTYFRSVVKPTLSEASHDLHTVRLFYPDGISLAVRSILTPADLAPFVIVKVSHWSRLGPYIEKGCTYMDITIAGPCTLEGLMGP